MNSFLCLDTINLGKSIEHIWVCHSGYNLKKCIILPEDLYIFINSVNPDEMQHNAAFHLGLHCLQKYSLRNFPNTKC